MSDITYRFLETTQELQGFVDLQCVIWDMDDRNAVPSNIIHAMIIAGGVAIGAYHQEELVGMSMSLPYYRQQIVALWSHMTGVHPAYQAHHIGFKLKQIQRIWALEHGYRQIRWTYDPLQRGNANFNMSILGVTSNTYHINLYGNQLGNLNAGLPTDRLEVTWQLEDPRVVRLADGAQLSPVTMRFPEENFIIRVQDGKIIAVPPEMIDSFQWYMMQIPMNINELKQENLAFATEWQMEIRNMLQHMFKRGCAVVDFVTQKDQCFYVLGTVDQEY